MENTNQDVFKLLSEMESVLDNCSNVPFSKKVAIDKEVLLDIIKDIRVSLPNQIKSASWVQGRTDEILDEAKKNAQSLVDKAEEYIKGKMSESEITKLAEENANRIKQESFETATQIKEGARDYAIEMLSRVNESIQKLNGIIESNIKELEDYDL